MGFGISLLPFFHGWLKTLFYRRIDILFFMPQSFFFILKMDSVQLTRIKQQQIITTMMVEKAFLNLFLISNNLMVKSCILLQIWIIDYLLKIMLLNFSFSSMFFSKSIDRKRKRFFSPNFFPLQSYSSLYLSPEQKF